MNLVKARLFNESKLHINSLLSESIKLTIASSYFFDICINSYLIDEAIERFRVWKFENLDAPVEAILEELRIVQTIASLRPAARPIIFIGTLFTENAITANEVTTNQKILKALAPSAIQQRHLISAFEWFCGTRYPVLLRYFPVILKNLFDNDLIEEDVFLKWGSDLTRNEYSVDNTMISLDTLDQLKTLAAPFLKWLEEAEEEDDDDEEEDDSAEEEG